MGEQKNNAMRLACALHQRAEDPAIVAQLARLLNYLPSQLSKDMCDLKEYLSSLEGDKT